MEILQTKTYKGYVKLDCDENIRLLDCNKMYSLVDAIADDIPNELKIKHECDNEDWTYYIDETIKNVCISLHISDEIITLDEALNNQILLSMGELNLEGHLYGYSEYTIEGLELHELKLVGNNGGHDLYEIIKSYKDKYIIMNINVYK